ncbi:alpha/beta fold hydrolase [Tistrella bauzanensis]|uniref:alpha/beta fold hydrolase n=1 Tax=Tistrella TaxID=171436 RepID=UPI0031F60267
MSTDIPTTGTDPHVYMVNGNPATARVQGDPSASEGPVLVLLHGAGLDRRFWRPVFDHAGIPLPIIAFDLPGRQGSEGEPLIRISDSAAWIVAALKAAGVRRCVLAGHSMGTLIAMETALLLSGDDETRVERLVLLAPADQIAVNPDLLEQTRTDPAAAQGLMNKWSYGIPDGPYCAEARANGADTPAGVLFADLTACDSFGSTLNLAAALSVPVDVVVGEADKMTRAKQGRALAEGLRHAEVTAIEGAGHMMLHETPEAVFAVLRRAVGAISPAV